MTTTSPTQRTLKYLRDKGYTAQVVEHWNAFAKRRIDLFGVIPKHLNTNPNKSILWETKDIGYNVGLTNV